MSAGACVDGPIGRFWLPESPHPRTLEVCRELTKQVWEGEYDHPELPGPEMQGHVIDIGAGWGAFSAWAFAKWPKAYVTAIEPNIKCREYIVANLARFIPSGRGTLAIPFAVTTRKAPRLNGCEDWGAYHVAEEGDACAWPVDAIHPANLPPCSILKLDCEGCEVEVLEHYPHLETCEALLVEYHGSDRWPQVSKLATAAGFDPVKVPIREGAESRTKWKGGRLVGFTGEFPLADYGPTVWLRR